MVSGLKTFGHKGCKIAVLKKFVFLANFALLVGLFWYRCNYLSALVERFFVSRKSDFSLSFTYTFCRGQGRPDKKSRIREISNLSTDADCRTDTILESLHDLSKTNDKWAG